jgi:hypothetical protein
MNMRLVSRPPKLVVTVIALAEKKWLGVACQIRVRTAKCPAQPSALTMKTATAKNGRKEQCQWKTNDETNGGERGA